MYLCHFLHLHTQQDIQWAPDDDVSVSSHHDFKQQYFVLIYMYF